MNVTLNTNTYRYNNQMQNRPVFKANPAGTAERAARELASGKSKFFEPFTNIYDKMTDWLSQHFTRHIIDNKYAAKTADKLKNTNNLFQHCLTLGSVITSGMYMYRTYNNKDMDKDRRKTLTVNQGLTLGVSTAGAYTLDKYLKSWWENVTSKYAGHQLADKEFSKDFIDLKTLVKQINKGLKKDEKADVFKLAENAQKDLKMSDGAKVLAGDILKNAVKDNDKVKSVKALNLGKFMDELVKSGRISKASETLSNRIKGMGLLRTMIVFGFVYRYFVPVAVTKPANILCDKYLERKKAKEQQNVQA